MNFETTVHSKRSEMESLTHYSNASRSINNTTYSTCRPNIINTNHVHLCSTTLTLANNHSYKSISRPIKHYYKQAFHIRQCVQCMQTITILVVSCPISFAPDSNLFPWVSFLCFWTNKLENKYHRITYTTPCRIHA